MLVLDTDHLSILQREAAGAVKLATRLRAANQPVMTTIITFEEAIRGWMAEINRAKSLMDQVGYYARLSQLLIYFASWDVLPFDTIAATRFQELRRLQLRNIGTQDLKIAAITLRHNATLLSANLRHFRLVPGLQVEDWIYSV